MLDMVALESGASVEDFTCALIMASSLALADGGVPLADLAACCHYSTLTYAEVGAGNVALFHNVASTASCLEEKDDEDEEVVLLERNLKSARLLLAQFVQKMREALKANKC